MCRVHMRVKRLVLDNTLNGRVESKFWKKAAAAARLCNQSGNPSINFRIDVLSRWRGF